MILLLNKKLLLLFLIQKRYLFIFNIEKKLMDENHKDCEYILNVALNNAKKRINLLDNLDKKCILDEYKEWINDGLNKHTVLLLREDPII